MFPRFTFLCCTFALLATLADAHEPGAGTQPEPVAVEPPAPAQAALAMTESSAIAFVRNYCIDCHQGAEAEGGLDLETFASASDVSNQIERWHKIADRLHQRQMPPPQSDLPPPESRQAMVVWIRDTIHAAVCDDGITPGPPMLRRLNRTEYGNTIRDLLGIHVNAGHALPAEGAGGEGFDNASETLFISPIHAEKYLDAAREALAHALKDPQARKRIIVQEPSTNDSPLATAHGVLADFLPRAFRRPVSQQEIGEYVSLFESAYQNEPSFEAALQLALSAALVSPKFLFLWEEPTDTQGPALLSQYELASRISYFLWASMPDETLFDLAKADRLHDDTVLAEQVARMLHSGVNRNGLRSGAKVREFAASFTEQWLGTRALGREFKPDAAIASKYDSELEGGMKYEPVFFFEDLLSDNRSLLNWIDSDFTYVNSRLARHYGIKGEFREQPRKVDLPNDSHRGGVLGMSAVLAVSSFPHRTSPVLRGKWILETLFGTPPPPPPADVPALDESGEADQPATLRQRLEMHRADAACASCHAVMDPLGFGLENFDVLGRWRTEVDAIAIDARGKLPDGTQFDGPAQLKQLLLERKHQFIRNFTAKMLGYALARGLTNEDQCVVDAIVEKLNQDDFRTQTLIIEIIKSVPFRSQQILMVGTNTTSGPPLPISADNLQENTIDGSQ